MRSIFFAASFQNKEEFKPIYEVLIKNGFNVSAPIFDYQSNVKLNYDHLMEHSFKEINKSDILLVDATYKEVGIGIEAGYAKALSKPIVYIRKRNSEISTTISGISRAIIEYETNDYSEIINVCNSLQL